MIATCDESHEQLARSRFACRLALPPLKLSITLASSAMGNALSNAIAGASNKLRSGNSTLCDRADKHQVIKVLDAFTDEELDFTIKYRIGRDADTGK